jgi:hypothetical protein
MAKNLQDHLWQHRIREWWMFMRIRAWSDTSAIDWASEQSRLLAISPKHPDRWFG